MRSRLNIFLQLVKLFFSRADAHGILHHRTKKKKRRYRTNEGLTKNIQNVKMKQMRRKRKFMNSKVSYPEFKWAEFASKDYLYAIASINRAYNLMLAIGKADDAFRVKAKGLDYMLNCDDKKQFKSAIKNIYRRYRNHIKAGKARLQNFQADTEIIPDPRRHKDLIIPIPTNRDVMTKEQILTFEQYLSTLNVSWCSICRESQIEEKPFVRDPNYVCAACTKRNDPEYFIRNNLHPVWYLVDDEGNYVLDENGKKCVQYHIPKELACLTMYEKLLIRRCANFVPTVHLSNGIFGIKGHCVSFPQDITEMCDELPRRKDTLVTFIRNLGSKDCTSIFPISLRVNRIKILNALTWLKKHNPFYKNIRIKEENFDWMNGKEEVNVGPDAVELNVKETTKSKQQSNEDEYVSTAHIPNGNSEEDSLPMRTVHANETRTVPSGRQAEPIKELVEIARNTGQTKKVMDFPPIDHDSPIS